MPTRANSEIIIYHRPLPGGLGLLSSCALEFWLSFRVPLCNTLGLRWCGHENQDIRWKWKATVSKLDIKISDNFQFLSDTAVICVEVAGCLHFQNLPGADFALFFSCFFLFLDEEGKKAACFLCLQIVFFFSFQEDHCSGELILIIQTSQIKHRGYNTKKVHKSHAC